MKTKGGKEDPVAKLYKSWSPEEQEADARARTREIYLVELKAESPDVRISRFPPTWP